MDLKFFIIRKLFRFKADLILIEQQLVPEMRPVVIYLVCLFRTPP